MGDMQAAPSRPLARVGRILFGAAFGAVIGIVAVIVIATSNDTTEGWALGLPMLFYGTPVAMLLSAVTGALWPSKARGPVARTIAPSQTRRLRDAPLAAWVMGVLGGLAAFAAYFIVAEGLFLLLGVFVGMLFPISMRVVAWLALIPVSWASAGTAVRVVRSVDARIQDRQ